MSSTGRAMARRKIRLSVGKQRRTWQRFERGLLRLENGEIWTLRRRSCEVVVIDSQTSLPTSVKLMHDVLREHKSVKVMSLSLPVSYHAESTTKLAIPYPINHPVPYQCPAPQLSTPYHPYCKPSHEHPIYPQQSLSH